MMQRVKIINGSSPKMIEPQLNKLISFGFNIVNIIPLGKTSYMAILQGDEKDFKLDKDLTKLKKLISGLK